MLNSKNKVIMGIDPGLATIGYGLINAQDKKNPQFISCGCIETKPDTEFKERLNIINKELTQLIKKYQPDVCGVEELFFAKNVKTAMSVGQARGVIIMTLSQNKVPIREFTPLQIKQALTSYGRAPKKQVEDMVMITLNLKQRPKKDDAADALAIALTTLYSQEY
ncbi:crossover junction endodeoxyribonuclease RuvC [bacterium]|nr:crossover junction endodeoxyribonuclease RuvC [bacterium]